MNLADEPTLAGAEAPMLALLAREERVRAALGVVLPWLVGGDDDAVLGEELVVRTRALLTALAADLLRGLAEELQEKLVGALGAALADRPDLLAHCHALALEGRAAERLAIVGLDPVLPPLFETLLATRDGETASLAMNALTAQARFTCRDRRMETIAEELPAELLHEALGALEDVAGTAGTAGTAAAATLRAGYAESRTRLALLGRLALDESGALLDPASSGVALFASALAQRAGVGRGEAVLALAPGQGLRLALLLRATGAAPASVRRALETVHPGSDLPPDSFELAPDQAAALLAGDQP